MELLSFKNIWCGNSLTLTDKVLCLMMGLLSFGCMARIDRRYQATLEVCYVASKETKWLPYLLSQIVTPNWMLLLFTWTHFPEGTLSGNFLRRLISFQHFQCGKFLQGFHPVYYVGTPRSLNALVLHCSKWWGTTQWVSRLTQMTWLWC